MTVRSTWDAVAARNAVRNIANGYLTEKLQHLDGMPADQAIAKSLGYIIGAINSLAKAVETLLPPEEK